MPAYGDFSGSATLTLDGSADGVIRWPSIFGGSVEGYEASMHCEGVVAKQAGQDYFTLSGQLNFSFNSYSESATVSNFSLN